MELLPKWELTGTLPAFSDDDSSTVIEMTYKLYQTMQTLISEYNSFADSVNSKILAFESEYHSDFESFTTSIRQEIQEFTNTFNSNIANLNSRVSEIDSKYQTSTTSLQNQINTINNILASDDVNLDTLQELVNALKNNVSSINDLFTELAKKVNITDYDAKITSIETQINTLSNNTYTKSEVDNLVASSGGSKLYEHNINTYGDGSNRDYISMKIISTDSTPITSKSELAIMLYNNGYTDRTKLLSVSGNNYIYNGYMSTYGIYSSDGVNITPYRNKLLLTKVTINETTYNVIKESGYAWMGLTDSVFSFTTIYDYVREL